MRTIRRTCLFVVLFGAAVVAPAAQAKTVLTVNSEVFPSGTPVPKGLSGSAVVVPGSTVTLTAPASIYGGGSPAVTYQFLFWNANASFRKTPTATFRVAKGETAVLASAWYVPESACSGPCVPGTGVSADAFSLNQNKVLTQSPFAAVTPPGAETGPNTVSTTTPAVLSAGHANILANPLIGGFGLFRGWFLYSGTGTVFHKHLSVPANGAAAAIALYGIPVPDPCQSDRNALASLSPADFLTPAAYHAAQKADALALQMCEVANGEAVTA